MKNSAALLAVSSAFISGSSLSAATTQQRAVTVTPQTPCLAIKTTDQVFEYRNMQATTFKRGDIRYVAVYGCLVTTVPEKIRSVVVSFVAKDALGAIISNSNGQQMLTPTQTIGFWSNKTPGWTVPAAAELSINNGAGSAEVKWVQVTVLWRELTGNSHTEVYLLSTDPKPLEGDAPTAPVDGDLPAFEAEPQRADCVLVGDQPRFKVEDVQLRLSRLTSPTGPVPIASYQAKVEIPSYVTMSKAWVTFSAFDRYGNFIGSDGGVIGGKKDQPPPPSTTVPEGFSLRTGNFARVSNRTLLTFQWYDTVGCRWSENHFVDAVRIALVARAERRE
ncbi:hypothetical protein [Novosphingobium sp.]|uniref:hypothetical protein n=1 Tax=Novosphingobium sp. TaxID=1874826 RepID=UPI0025E36A1C|nr:hypothetical protein [Novosphingobium sp.]